MDDSVDAMFSRLRACTQEKLSSGQGPNKAPAYWMSVWDDKGFDCSETDGVLALPRLAEAGGLIACASVTYFKEKSGTEAVVAYVIGREPRNSDIRRAAIKRDPSGPSIGDWKYIV
jgi:hypothetical protein